MGEIGKGEVDREVQVVTFAFTCSLATWGQGKVRSFLEGTYPRFNWRLPFDYVRWYLAANAWLTGRAKLGCRVGFG